MYTHVCIMYTCVLVPMAGVYYVYMCTCTWHVCIMYTCVLVPMAGVYYVYMCTCTYGRCVLCI